MTKHAPALRVPRAARRRATGPSYRATVLICRASSSNSFSSLASFKATTEMAPASASSGAGATTRVVLWFRNDLRLSDNPTCKQAESLATR